MTAPATGVLADSWGWHHGDVGIDGSISVEEYEQRRAAMGRASTQA